jgi:hypothetical protein
MICNFRFLLARVVEDLKKKMVLGNPRNPENPQHLQSLIRELHRALETHGLRSKTAGRRGLQELACGTPLPFIMKHVGKAIFQDDNASVHTAKSAKEWKVAEKLVVMQWPRKVQGKS